jgi:dihydroorotase
MEILIRNARIIDANNDFTGDVYVKDGIISEIGASLRKDCRVLDAKNLVLMPAFCDLHVHFRDPGFTDKEDIISGSLAAARGGYTTVNLMANTKPVCSSMDIVNYVKNKAKETGLVDVHQTVSITRNMDGLDISHLDEIDKTVRFISDDGKGVLNEAVMLNAMKKAKSMGITVIAHEEQSTFSKFDTRLSEDYMTARDIELAMYTKCKFHAAHVSTAGAMEKVIYAKQKCRNITAEVTPHHIALTNDCDYSVNPPLRTQNDADYLIGAIKNGYVDAISTDHAPHTAGDKKNGAPGISGIETAFSVCFTKLVRCGYINLNMLSRLMSCNPSHLMGYKKGLIVPGYDGDLVLIDINKKYRVDKDKFASKGKNTPFDGMYLYGKVMAAIKAGNITYIEEEL